jgi:hypothetical protein
VLNNFKKPSFMLTRKMAISAALIGITVVAFASMGGGKSKSKKVTAGFTPIRTSQGFTLKAGPTYRGSMILNQERTDHYIAFNSLVTYQNGNTTYILPNRYRVNLCSAGTRSNLQLLNFKINLHK